jgi:hypothetical protein
MMSILCAPSVGRPPASGLLGRSIATIGETCGIWKAKIPDARQRGMYPARLNAL